jgi:hypothetical protein
MKLLHALAHDDDSVTAFPRQQCAPHLMQIIEGVVIGSAAGAAVATGDEAGYSTMSGPGVAGRGSLSAGNSRSELLVGADGSAAVDVVAAVKALDVLVAVSRVDQQLLTGVKEYPGEQQGSRAFAYAMVLQC